jgi:N4-(beta-N-acetylglucosaminyl)-L-asparaginase
MPVSRRKFLAQAAATTAAGVLSSTAAEREAARQPKERPLFVSTWPFGKPANDKGLQVLQNGGSLLDAVELGIGVVEADPSNTSVGLGGKPNSAGVVQLDACIMYGPGHKGGSVAAMERVAHPISVARRVMEKTRHVMLVGEGARQFAISEGLAPMLYDKLVPRDEGSGRKFPPKPSPKNHDTIALLALGSDGTIAGGCSTSGLADKLPGRVGDSPILGSGLYVDNDVGAAGATGIGENIMRYCGSFQIVELMRQGRTPEEACIELIKRIARKDPRGLELSINFVALNKDGEFGAAGTGKGFAFAVTTKSFSRVQQSAAVSKL